MTFEEFWVRLLAGVTFSQPIKSDVARRWRIATMVLLGGVLAMTCLHYWAQDIVGPLTLVPLAFCLLLSLFDPTTRLITTVFYISLLTFVGALFLVAYLLIATQGEILSVDHSLQAILLFNFLDSFLALQATFLTVQILSEHDLPDTISRSHEESPEMNDLTRMYSNLENQPLWRSFEGAPYKVDSI